MLFQSKHILSIPLLALALVSLCRVANGLEDSDIDGGMMRTHKHRHHFKRQRNRSGRYQGIRVRTTHHSAQFLHSYDDYYDNNNNQQQENERISYNVTKKVGDTVVLYCAVNSSLGSNPGVIWMQGKQGNVLTLNTNRISADGRFEVIQTPVQQFSQIANNQAEMGQSNRRRNSQQVPKYDLSFYHLKINNVQVYDENEYSCETTISMTNGRPNLQSIVHLKVTQPPAFVESMTSGGNVEARENTDVVLSCHAIGKPRPIVRWFKIPENGEPIDLKHHRNDLVIKNISRNDLFKYECDASNGILPSISKKFSINIKYAPIVVPIKSVIHQINDEPLLIGCRILSNPESQVKWYRKKQTSLANKSSFDQFEEIDLNNNQRYQNLNFKQTNQTVTYFKIKVLQPVDYTQFKCVATNPIGMGESVIDVRDAKDFRPSDLRNKNKYKSVASGVASSENSPPLLDVVDYLYDEDYSTLDREKSRGDPSSKRLYTLRNHKNGTFYKYSVNNRLMDKSNKQDSLHSMNGSNSAMTRFSVQSMAICLISLLVVL